MELTRSYLNHQDASPQPSGEFRYQAKGEKHKYKLFSNEMDSKIKAEHDYSIAITDDDSFLHRYSMLSKDMLQTAEKIFGHMKPFKPRINNITNAKIKGLVISLHTLGGAIRLEKSEMEVHVSLKARLMHQFTYLEYLHQEDQVNDDISFLTYLQRRCCLMYKNLYREHTQEIAL